IERITRHIMAVPGVRTVQSASRPDGTVPEQATLSYQAGVLGRQFGDTMDSLTRRLKRVSELDGALAQTQRAVDGLGDGLRGGGAGLADVSGAAEDMRAGMDGLQRNVTTVSGYLDPLRDFVGRTPDCAVNPICSTVDRVLQPVDSLVQASARLDAGATKLNSGSSTAATAMAG